MELKHTEHNGNLLLSLNGGLTIFQAAERKPELLHALAQASRTLSLDLSRVDEIDTAGIQLLLLLKREAARNGLQLEVAAYSPAVLAAFDLLQLHSLFDAETVSLAEGAS
ncbi:MULTISPECIES: STAS domain-containing protein [unclassified Herbaspirillum]|uniref:STAS domain-containing protein n=1 Tax=unclassified Herbaspirillum TaxID=2624150 RepID=UPI00115434AB|nr:MULTISPECIES: STAS domain-containing protein [unclassified Herbaspirillum]MBB5392421.1 anti-anti-sigma factor [Herbaspirillum sp. SJZ102]TQK06060.1 anti-anti-sigma factor [Herbaspirillum sp. SJZ130]TQK12462.1 anti-anti-sigma factor [Herbaspirillum sp. SJZ106]